MMHQKKVPPPPRPPRHLRPETKQLWTRINKEYVLGLDAQKVLASACESLDLVAVCREAIAKNGIAYVDRYGSPRQRPEVSTWIAAQRTALHAFSQLNLELPEIATPPAMGGKGR